MRFLMWVAAFALLSGCQSSTGMSDWFQFGKSVATEAGFSEQAKAADAVYDTLSSASNVASLAMGKQGSYDIPLPEQIRSMEPALAKVGLGGVTQALKAKMNEAASQAAGEAAPYFTAAAKNMTIADALGLMLGGDTSVTDYFRGQTETPLAGKMQPVVQSKLKATGFYDQYQTFLGAYKLLPLAKKPDLDIEAYVVDKTLDGLYNRIGEEEKAIRKDPKKAGSALVEQLLAKPGA